MNTQSLEYQKSFIDALDSVSPVNHRMLLSKIGEKVNLHSNNLASNFCYILEAPLSYLNMPVDKIGLIDFCRFKKFFDYKSTKTESASLALTVDDNGEAVDMLFKNEGTSDTLTLRLGDTSLPQFEASFNSFDKPQPDVSMKFSEDMIEEMKKKISIVGSDYVDMNVNENVLNFCIYSMRSADRADYPIMLETPCTKSFKLKFSAELFNLLPTANYEAQIDSEGMFFLKQIREDEIDLSVALLSED